MNIIGRRSRKKKEIDISRIALYAKNQLFPNQQVNRKEDF